MFFQILVIGLIFLIIYKRYFTKQNKQAPPIIKGKSLVMQSLTDIWKDPINFAFENQKKYGNCFTTQGPFGIKKKIY